MPDREEGNPLTKREFERLLTRAAQPLDSAPPEHSVGTDLSSDYLQQAIARLSKEPLPLIGA